MKLEYRIFITTDDQYILDHPKHNGGFRAIDRITNALADACRHDLAVDTIDIQRMISPPRKETRWERLRRNTRPALTEMVVQSIRRLKSFAKNALRH